MKECKKCKHSAYNFWANFCTQCGSELMEVKQEYRFCPNTDCKRFTGEYQFMLTDKYCDCCGVLLVTEGGLKHG